MIGIRGASGCYGLPILKTMAEAERFAKEYRSISIVPTTSVGDLPAGQLSLTDK